MNDRKKTLNYTAQLVKSEVNVIYFIAAILFFF